MARGLKCDTCGSFDEPLFEESPGWLHLEVPWEFQDGAGNWVRPHEVKILDFCSWECLALFAQSQRLALDIRRGLGGS